MLQYILAKIKAIILYRDATFQIKYLSTLSDRAILLARSNVATLKSDPTHDDVD